MRFGNKNEGDPLDYQQKARLLVGRHYNRHIRPPGDSVLDLDDIYVVWFAKTLQNWKALVSTTVPDDRYYEVTRDGDKRMIYLDVYVKQANIEIPEEQ